MSLQNVCVYGSGMVMYFMGIGWERLSYMVWGVRKMLVVMGANVANSSSNITVCDL